MLDKRELAAKRSQAALAIQEKDNEQAAANNAEKKPAAPEAAAEKAE